MVNVQNSPDLPPDEDLPRGRPAPQANAGTASSRADLVRPAQRRKSLARVAISGPSGGGKTWSALGWGIAFADGGDVICIDTERESAELYADTFKFLHLPWAPPYDPRDLAATIRELSRLHAHDEHEAVVIIDSASHFWRGQGGTLDIASGVFGKWKTARPAQQDLIDAILTSSMHVIVCTRSKMDYKVDTGDDGKQTVTTLGLAPIQDDDLEYEFTVFVTIDRQHRIDVGKTRCDLLAGKSYQPNHQLELAETLAEWLKGGEPLITMAAADALRERTKLIEPQSLRNECRAAIKRQYGEADRLRESDLAPVLELVAGFEAKQAEALAAEAPAGAAGMDAELAAEVHQLILNRAMALPVEAQERVQTWCAANNVILDDERLSPTPPIPELLQVLADEEAAAQAA